MREKHFAQCHFTRQTEDRIPFHNIAPQIGVVEMDGWERYGLRYSRIIEGTHNNVG